MLVNFPTASQKGQLLARDHILCKVYNSLCNSLFIPYLVALFGVTTVLSYTKQDVVVIVRISKLKSCCRAEPCKSTKRKNDMLYYFYSGKLSKISAGPEPTLAGWATWSAWSACTKRCNSGRESRFRTCRTNVADSFAKYVADEISFEQYLKLTPQCKERFTGSLIMD